MITHRDPDKQNHRTPPAFTRAVSRRFGRLTFDLAATSGEQIEGVKSYFTPEMDSLKQDWGAIQTPGNVWLNPPFSHIRPWVAKLDKECRDLPRWTLCLIPASMGSIWWGDHVLNKCIAIGVTRMAFVGSKAIYPKDLALICYGFGVSGHDFWKWTAES